MLNSTEWLKLNFGFGDMMFDTKEIPNGSTLSYEEFKNDIFTVYSMYLYAVDCKEVREEATLRVKQEIILLIINNAIKNSYPDREIALDFNPTNEVLIRLADDLAELSIEDVVTMVSI